MFKKLSKKINDLRKKRKHSNEDDSPVHVEEKKILQENNQTEKSIFRDPKKLFKISTISLVLGLALGFVMDITTDREAEEAKINDLREQIINIEDTIDSTKLDLEKYEEYKEILESIDTNKEELEKVKGDK